MLAKANHGFSNIPEKSIPSLYYWAHYFLYLCNLKQMPLHIHHTSERLERFIVHWICFALLYLLLCLSGGYNILWPYFILFDMITTTFHPVCVYDCTCMHAQAYVHLYKFIRFVRETERSLCYVGYYQKLNFDK